MKINAELLKNIRIADLPDDALLTLEQALLDLELGELPELERDLTFFAEVLIAKEMWKGNKAKGALAQIENIVISAQAIAVPADAFLVRKREREVSEKHGVLSKGMKSHLKRLHERMGEGLMKLKEKKDSDPKKNEEHKLKIEQKMRFEVWKFLETVKFNWSPALILQMDNLEKTLNVFGFLENNIDEKEAAEISKLKYVNDKFGERKLIRSIFDPHYVLKNKDFSSRVGYEDLKIFWKTFSQKYYESPISKMSADEIAIFHAKIPYIRRVCRIYEKSDIEFRKKPGRIVESLLKKAKDKNSLVRIADESCPSNLRALASFEKKYGFISEGLLDEVAATGKLAKGARIVSDYRHRNFFRFLSNWNYNHKPFNQIFSAILSIKKPDILFSGDVLAFMQPALRSQPAFSISYVTDFFEAVKETGDAEYLISLLKNQQVKALIERAPHGHSYCHANFKNILVWSARNKEKPLYENQALIDTVYNEKNDGSAEAFWSAIQNTGKIREMTDEAFLSRMNELSDKDSKLLFWHLKAISETRDFDTLASAEFFQALEKIRNVEDKTDYLSAIANSKNAKKMADSAFIEKLLLIEKVAPWLGYLEQIRNEQDLEELSKQSFVDHIASNSGRFFGHSSMLDAIKNCMTTYKDSAFVASLVTSKRYNDFVREALSDKPNYEISLLKAIASTRQADFFLGNSFRTMMLKDPIIVSNFLTLATKQSTADETGRLKGKMTVQNLFKIIGKISETGILGDNSHVETCFHILSEYIKKNDYIDPNAQMDKLIETYREINNYKIDQPEKMKLLYSIKSFISDSSFNTSLENGHLERFLEANRKVATIEEPEVRVAAANALDKLLRKDIDEVIKNNSEEFFQVFNSIRNDCKGRHQVEKIAFDTLANHFSFGGKISHKKGNLNAEKISRGITSYAAKLAANMDPYPAVGRTDYAQFLYSNNPIVDLEIYDADLAESLLHLKKLIGGNAELENRVLDGMKKVASSKNLKREWFDKKGMEIISGAYADAGQQENSMLDRMISNESFELSFLEKESADRLKEALFRDKKRRIYHSPIGINYLYNNIQIIELSQKNLETLYRKSSFVDSVKRRGNMLADATAISFAEEFFEKPFSEKKNLAAILKWAQSALGEASKVPEHKFYFANYPFSWRKNDSAFVLGVVRGRLKPAVALAVLESLPNFGAENLQKISELLPQGGRLSKDKYSLAVFLSFVKEKPAVQQRVMNYFLSGKPKANDDIRMLSVMSFANSLGDEFVQGLEKKPFTTSSEALARSRELAIDFLSKKYDRGTLNKCPLEKLESWLTVYPEFEQTMKIHNDADLIPSLRLIATIELLGKQREFALHDKTLREDLLGHSDRYFPDQAERGEVLKYLEKWGSMEDENRIFGTASRADVLGVLSSWRQPTRLEHTLSEISVVDRLEDVQAKLDDVFYKNHFSNEFLQVAGIYDGAPTMEALAAKFRDLKASSAPKNELDAVRREQDSVRKWSRLQSVFFNYGKKMEELKGEIKSAGAGLAQYESTLAEWGFDYGDSFGNKVFLGEVKLLESRVKREIAVKPQDQKLSAIASEVAKIAKACENAENYVRDLAERLEPAGGKGGTLESLRNKQKWAEETKHAFESNKLSFSGTVEKIRKEEPSFFDAIEKQLIGDHKNLFLSQALLRYTDITAINDLEAIVSIARNESTEKNTVLSYFGQQTFSQMLLAMTGQCLDYRYSKNSIGNAPFTVSYADSFRQLVVAYASDDRELEHPQVNGLIFLASVKEGEESFPGIVLDRIYATGSRDLGWSKIEGHVRFALQKAKETGLPLVVPDHLSNYYVQVNEWAKSEGFVVREPPEGVKVVVQPGPSGTTYCELAGYNSYEKDAELSIKSLVIEQKRQA